MGGGCRPRCSLPRSAGAAARDLLIPGRYQEGAEMSNAVVVGGDGAPEVLKWAPVPPPELVEGQIRIKVRAAGASLTDLALRAGFLKDIPLPPAGVLGFEAAGTVDA